MENNLKCINIFHIYVIKILITINTKTVILKDKYIILRKLFIYFSY